MRIADVIARVKRSYHATLSTARYERRLADGSKIHAHMLSKAMRKDILDRMLTANDVVYRDVFEEKIECQMTPNGIYLKVSPMCDRYYFASVHTGHILMMSFTEKVSDVIAKYS